MKRWIEKDGLEKDGIGEEGDINDIERERNKLILNEFHRLLFIILNKFINDFELKFGVQLQILEPKFKNLHNNIECGYSRIHSEYRNQIYDTILFLSIDKSFSIGLQSIQFLRLKNQSLFQKTQIFLEYNENQCEDWCDINDDKQKGNRQSIWYSGMFTFRDLLNTDGFKINRNTLFVEKSKYRYYDIDLTEDTYKIITNVKQIADVFQSLKDELISELIIEINNFEKKIIEDRILNEKKVIVQKKDLILRSLPKDSKGQLSIIEVDSFFQLIEKYEQVILGKEMKLLQKFIRLSNYLKFKREGLLTILSKVNEIESIGGYEYEIYLVKDKNDSEAINDFEYYVNLFEEENNVLNQLLVYSINMIVSLIENKMVVFFSIYEKFDELGIFNTQWEIEMKNKLNNINSNLTDINSSLREVLIGIYKLESNLRLELNKLGKDMEHSINSLGLDVNKHLVSIDSNLGFNNLLTAINAYQSYKTNKKLSH